MLLSPASSPKSLLEQQVYTLRTALSARKSAYFRLIALLQAKASTAQALEEGIETSQRALCTEKLTINIDPKQLNQDKSAISQAFKATEMRVKLLREGLESADMALRTNKQVAESKAQEVWRLFKIHRLLKEEIRGLCDPCKVISRLCPVCQAQLLRRVNLSNKGK